MENNNKNTFLIIINICYSLINNFNNLETVGICNSLYKKTKYLY